MVQKARKKQQHLGTVSAVAIAQPPEKPKVHHVSGVSDVERVLYKSMGLLQLAKEAAKARQRGHKEEERAIRIAARQHLQVIGQSVGESREAARARYEEELHQYDELVERFIERSGDKPKHAAQAHSRQHGQGHRSKKLRGKHKVREKKSPEAPQLAVSLEAEMGRLNFEQQEQLCRAREQEAKDWWERVGGSVSKVEHTAGHARDQQYTLLAARFSVAALAANSCGILAVQERRTH